MTEPARPLRMHTKTPSELVALNAADRAGAPFICFRDREGALRIRTLRKQSDPLYVGRSEDADISLDWDGTVSHVHARLEYAAAAWLVVDDGLSTNGTFVNGERVLGRHRLRGGDLLRVGRTLLEYREPAPRPPLRTVTDDSAVFAAGMSPERRRLLVALCRPMFKAHDADTGRTASNEEIMERCGLPSVDAVKQRLSGIYRDVGLAGADQRGKRDRLAELAVAQGIVGPRDYTAS